MVNAPTEKTFFFFLEGSKILKGREGNRPTGACPPYYFSFVFFVFFLIFFPFLAFLLSFYSIFPFVFFPCFFYPYSGHSGGLLIVPTVTRFYYFTL